MERVVIGMCDVVRGLSFVVLLVLSNKVCVDIRDGVFGEVDDFLDIVVGVMEEYVND